ncbi:anhydro-N-acetylmuramic acid kinase [Arenibacter sp. GZD96]|uniref:anhydro-N-acetylmuramic acid kinase n=1 Tax=Aurantibrevibacter litoralis TaxID=3106030 RepID=UPI002AFFF5EC|nr:anhydro-N-acetylmuramic acid kinase [Arenibacter sp. GZD-96]MEA1785059.1 anhydro-N-acetylmuramic acid kinase [Arenibacter sp. GZD-96]
MVCVLGLMSGTSLDGLDMAYCRIWNQNSRWKFEIVQSQSVTYDAAWQARLKNAIFLSAEDLLCLHNSYGSWLGTQVKKFVEKSALKVDFVASHGHTTHHQPQKGFTFQVGSGQHLANACGLKVVCDFRTNDIALGGQGAPLVPIGDQLFFSAYDFCLNLGGISNISFAHQQERIAYDIGLANMILNHITRKVGLAYDNNGDIAKQGSLNPTMLYQLNQLPYYQLSYPKSIGYEWFVAEVIPIIEETQDTLENLLHTATHHICEQIAIQIKRHSSKEKSTLLVTGGGALNGFLIQTLKDKLGTTTQVEVPSKTLIENKEALIFALMGVLRIENKMNVMRSVTGALRDSSSGVIYDPS